MTAGYPSFASEKITATLQYKEEDALLTYKQINIASIVCNQ